MTGPENERLAVVETEIQGLRRDVTGIKADVKTLLAFQASAAGGLGTFRGVVPFLALAISILAIAIRY